MPSRKQQRRRQKLQRHEYEEVYIDEEGRELDPEEAEELVGPRPARNAKATKAAPARRSGRALEPPSWRRTLRRAGLFFPLMVVAIHVIDPDLAWGRKLTQAIFLLAFFVPFSYFMDSVMWRSYQRRLDRTDEKR